MTAANDSQTNGRRDACASTDVTVMIEHLQQPGAFPGVSTDTVQVRETHISWIFLVGDFAFKVKKPITLDFLDYSTIEKRREACEQELRLDGRYAPDLYLSVVPIVMHEGRLKVDAPAAVRDGGRDSDVVDYAVKMRRFPDDALLSESLDSGRVGTDDVIALARHVAAFHATADPLKGHPDCDQLGSLQAVLQNARDNLDALQGLDSLSAAHSVRVLRQWTEDYFEKHHQVFQQRVVGGFIRECHGDLHLANVVRWRGRWVPFDGIEFNETFRWIDVISDAAFAAMDFSARGHQELGRSFINAYLEATGDHASLAVLRWYLVYRATTRAKVAALRAAQSADDPAEHRNALRECEEYVELAYQFSLPETPTLWITHGVSGSGKTTASEAIVQRAGAIRLRSDLERKRHFGMPPTERPGASQVSKIYGTAGTHATYARLLRLSRGILRAGFTVIVDATFLKHEDRERFRALATCEGAEFAILHCDADVATLRQRIADRMRRDDDASDADWSVLSSQLESEEPLDEREQRCAVAASELSAGQAPRPDSHDGINP